MFKWTYRKVHSWIKWVFSFRTRSILNSDGANVFHFSDGTKIDIRLLDPEMDSGKTVDVEDPSSLKIKNEIAKSEAEYAAYKKEHDPIRQMNSVKFENTKKYFKFSEEDSLKIRKGISELAMQVKPNQRFVQSNLEKSLITLFEAQEDLKKNIPEQCNRYMKSVGFLKYIARYAGHSISYDASMKLKEVIKEFDETIIRYASQEPECAVDLVTEKI